MISESHTGFFAVTFVNDAPEAILSADKFTLPESTDALAHIQFVKNTRMPSGMLMPTRLVMSIPQVHVFSIEPCDESGER